MSETALIGIKIVTAKEMARVEGLALAEGASDLAFMENAAAAVAEMTADFILSNGLPKMVSLLVGKGNNGGDAYATGSKLIEMGYSVEAYHIYAIDACGPLCKTMHERFKSRGGIVHMVHDMHNFFFEPKGLILDGLVGTGFAGKAEDALAMAIESANSSGLPILAIDIPSGLNGNTGEVETVAINATQTIYLELPKSGFFLKRGLDHVGELRCARFGLPEKFLNEAKPVALWADEDAPVEAMPPIQRTRHKYQAGYVLAVAGSSGMSGAAILSSYAALRSGAGIVRLFYPYEIESELSHAPYELIREGWDQCCLDRIQEESRRAKALILGPGVGRSKQAKKMVRALLEQLDLPMVVDADALYFIAENPRWKLPATVILTPHLQEMAHLLQTGGDEKTDLENCQAFAEERKATVVLKGAATFIFHPKSTPLCITRGDPGMATAGSGDVLTGIIGALLAQGLPARHAAALGVYIHGLAGESAAEENTSYCMTASDILHCLPEAFMELE
ncbi:MAG: NAD(P)H-hydrate dehydratase [Chlamydiota bacterium]